MGMLIRTLAGQSGLATAVLRAIMGLVLGYAGYLKVFRGDMAIGYLGQLGLPWPHILGPGVSFLELFGGFALFVGLFTRYLGMLYTAQFLVAAYLITQTRGFWEARLEFLMMAGAFLLATSGAGALGIDRPGQRWEP